jgi:PAS domain S-box-containing protein
MEILQLGNMEHATPSPREAGWRNRMNDPNIPPPRLEVGEAQFRAVLDNIPVRIALFDRERRHWYVNREYAAFAGYAADEIIGRNVAEVIGTEAFGPLRHYYEQLAPFGNRALAGEAVHWEGWLPDRGRQGLCFVQRYYVPYEASNGQIEGYFVFTRDLTELKRSERQLAEQLQALRISEASNAAVISAALDCVIVIDESGRVVEFNPAAERTFGYKREFAVGVPVSDLIVPPALRDAHRSGFARYLESGVARMMGQRVEIEGMRASGEVFPLELAVTEVRLADRRLFIAYLRDLTEAKAAAAQLQRQKEALEQSERLAAFGSLLAGVAHELNNPLSIVLGGALILQEQVEIEMPALAARAERIRVAAERCSRIVRTFLAMARQQAAVSRPLAAGTLVDDALELLAYGLRSDGIAIIRDLPRDLPLLLGDADQLQQVIANLLTNARQALEQRASGREVRISARAIGSEIEISIGDNGPGVPSAFRQRIFDPYFTTKPAGMGTGIGLAVSRGIAEAHGGSLTLMDSTDEGACFSLRVPQAALQSPVAATEKIVAAALPVERRHVLVVDDETEMAKLLDEMLRPLGFECDHAVNGIEAKRLLGLRKYDAILCDLRMPELGGAGLYEWIQSEHPELCARTAFITGDALGQGAGVALLRTGRPVLEKPFRPDAVRTLVKSLVDPE